MKTEQLIDNLSSSMKPVKAFTPGILSLLWLSATMMLVFLGVTIGLGIRDDIQAVIQTPHFILMILSLCGIFASGAFAAFSAALPGKETSPWVWLAPFLFFILFAVSVLPPFTAKGVLHDTSPVGFQCTFILATLGVVPLAFLIALLRSLAVTRIKFAARFAGLSAMALGALGLSLYCTSTECPHLFLYHCLPVLALGILTQFAASRFLRW